MVKNCNKLLVSKGYDESKNQEFYRCLGGGIEFLEKSEAIWVDINKFKNKELILYPEQIFKYL